MHRLPSVLILLAALGMPLCFSGCDSSAPAAGNDKAAESDLASVTVVSPQRVGLTRTTTQPATVRAYFSADVHAKVSGYLQRLYVEIGDEVGARDTLATLRVPEMQRQKERQDQLVKRLEADEKRASAQVALARANVVAATAAREEARSKLARYQAELTAAESEFARITELVEKESVARRLLDEAIEHRDAAKAARQAAEAAVTTAEANVTVAEAKQTAAKADLESAEAETEVERKRAQELDELLKYATLTAPFPGIVTARNVDPGDLVRNVQTTDSGPVPLFTIDDIDRVRVHVAVPEADAPWVDDGDAATLRLRAIGGEALEGEVTRHAHRLDDSTQTLDVEIVLDNPQHRLLPGMYGEATIELEEKPDALVLPASAVRHDETGRSYVYVLGSGDTVSEVEVTTGLDDGKRIEITGGIDDNARVVDAIVGRLQPGQKVRVQ